ncbi:MAG: oligosaccharide flippase family protein [Thermoplasmata archaeon]
MSAVQGTEVRDGLSTVTRGTIYLIVTTFLFVLFSFLSRVLLVRSISPGDWSAFAFGFTAAGVLSAVGALGLPLAVARSLPYSTSDSERRTIVRTAFTVGGVAAATSAVALGLSGPTLGNALGSPAIGFGLEFFAIAAGFSIVSNLIAAVFQGFADVLPNALFVQVLNPALFLGFVVAAVTLPPRQLTYHDALITYAVAAVVTTVGLVVYALRRLPRRLPPGPGAPHARGELLRFTAPLFVVGAMATLLGSSDTLVLGIFRSGEVGTYTASLTLARLLLVGINAAAYVFLPVAARFVRRGDSHAVRLTYATITKWLVALSMPLLFLFVLLPSESLGFVYGSAYSTTVLPLQITVLGAFAMTLLGPSTVAQVAYGYTRLLAYNAIAAAATDVVLALLLVPRMGYVGAAIAWSSAAVLYSGLALVEIASSDRIHPFRRQFVVPLAVAALPVAALFLVFRPTFPGWALPPLGLALAGLFVLVTVATRSIDEGDRLLLEAVERLIGRPLPFVRRLGRRVVRKDLRR